MKKRILITCLALSILAGCVQPIVLDPGDPQKPVVVSCVIGFENGRYKDEFYVHDNQYQIFYWNVRPILTLQYAKGKSQEEFIPVEDAVVYFKQVYIFDTDSPIRRDIFFVHLKGSTWVTEDTFHLLPNTTYTLVVEIPGRDPIRAESRTPPEMSFSSQDGEFAVELKMETRPEQLQQCALWITANEYTELEDEAKSLEYLTTDHPGADAITLTGRKFAELSFLGDPDSPQEIEFKNEYDRAKGYLSDYPLYKNYIRIGSLDSPSPFFIYAGPMDTPRTWEAVGGPPPDRCATWTGYLLSGDLDRYVRSAVIHKTTLDTDLSAIYSTEEEIYSNINGGYGIFGFYSRNTPHPFMREYDSWEHGPVRPGQQQQANS